MKISMKHIYIPPSSLLGTHGPLTHDLAMTFDRNPRPKTLDFKTKQNKRDTSSLTDMTLSSKAKKGTRTSSSISFMACLMECKTDIDETPTYAYAKSFLITDGGHHDRH